MSGAARGMRGFYRESRMKRILIACVAIAVGAGTVPAASPAVDLAIKTIESVGADAGKLKIFCNLNKLLQDAGDKDDPAIQKQIDDLVTQLGPDFSAAWDIGDELDENSPDGQEFYGAVDTLAEKCRS
jgi:hypothetical protein